MRFDREVTGLTLTGFILGIVGGVVSVLGFLFGILAAVTKMVVIVAVALLLAGCDRPPFADPVLPPAPPPKGVEGPRTCPKLPPGFACASDGR